MKRLFLIFGFMWGVAAIASAQSSTPGVNQRQRNQVHRVQEGVQSGELTRAETRRMARQQQRVNQDKKAAKADGVVTPQERRQLKREQDRTSRRLYRQKHDAQDRQ